MHKDEQVQLNREYTRRLTWQSTEKPV